MQENQYFTPSIEDIRVGYECEMYNPSKKEWNEFIVKDSWFGRDGEGDLPEVYSAILPGFSYDLKPSEKIRVPYLTKEQIEADGWEYMNSSKFSSTVLYFQKKTTDGVISLELCINDHNIAIGYDLYEPMYNGYCPSINEFRYICKLLKIK